MIRYAVDRSRQTRGGMFSSVAIHSLLLLLLAFALRQGAPLPIAPEELTKVTYIEAHEGENVAQKIRTKTRETRHPKLAEGRGISTRSAKKPKPLGQPGKLPKIESPKRTKVAEIAAPTPDAQRVRPRELASDPRLEANARELASASIPAPNSRRSASVDDASSAAPRLKSKTATHSFEGATTTLQSKRSAIDLAGGDIDPPARSTTGSQRGLAETGVTGPGKATLQAANGSGSAFRPAAPSLDSSRRSGSALAEAGSDDIATVGNGGTADSRGRRTILDYGNGNGGGLRGRVGGKALATESGRVEPTSSSSDRSSRIADADAVDLSQQGMGMTITGQISGRKILQVSPPIYSRSAKQQGWEGVVAVHFTVLPDGRVKDNVYLDQTSAHRDLNQSALTAIRKFRFAPLNDSDPQVEQWGVITFVFRLK